MLNTELPFVVAGFNRCLKCAVQRSNLSSFVFRRSTVVETNLLIWGLHFRRNCFDSPNTSFSSPLSEWPCIVSPLSFSHCLLSDLNAFRTSLQQLENTSSAFALLFFLNCNSVRFLIKASVSTVIQGLRTRFSGMSSFVAAALKAVQKLSLPKLFYAFNNIALIKIAFHFCAESFTRDFIAQLGRADFWLTAWLMCLYFESHFSNDHFVIGDSYLSPPCRNVVQTTPVPRTE